MALAEKLSYDEESESGRHNVSERVIEDLYDEGDVSEFYREDYIFDAWEDKRGKGKNRKGNSEKS